MDIIREIQQALKYDGFYTGTVDGSWGPLSQSAMDAAIHGEQDIPGEHRVQASSFADPKDLSSFNLCKKHGGTDQECYKVGDDGQGFGGKVDCTADVPLVALPYEDWEEKWGNVSNAINKAVRVTVNGITVICKLGDTMPHRAHIRNGRGIDLNFAATKAFGLNPPVDAKAVWSWA